MDFIEDCCDWLKPFGYTLHSRSGNKTFAVFTKDDEFSPTIECHISDLGDKRCKVMSSAHFKLFLTLTTGELSFRHPDIQRYIDVLTHYAKTAFYYPPAL